MCFLDKKSIKVSIKIVGAIVRECVNLGGPLCVQLSQLFSEGKYLDIINFEFNYDECDGTNESLNDFLYARQIQALLSKQSFLDLKIDKEAISFAKFIQSEQNCREVNHRFRTCATGKSGVAEVLYISQRKIASILGDVPPISDLQFSFGPGTNTSTTMDETNPRIKLSSSLMCSANFLPFARSFIEEFPLWSSVHSFNRIDFSHGKLSFVPKSCKTLRAIIVEPIINGFYQKGIGKEMKKLLRAVGLNLSDQKPNQNAALRGSRDGDIATLDLVGASDNMAYGLVLDQIPPGWFHLLEVGRTSTVEYEGKIFELQKFSSMGNAYTFELESLIFYSLALSTCEYLGLSSKDVRSYGDDIVVPVGAVDLLKDVLDYCGFSINLDKSYWKGPFRESCGADYLYGMDIRPFYLKEQISERTLYLMHNWFVRHCEPQLAAVVKSFVRPDIALYGPDGYGDGHLIGDYTLRQTRKHRRNGFEGGVFDTYTLGKKYNKVRLPGDYVYPCYSTYVRDIDCDDNIPDIIYMGTNPKNFFSYKEYEEYFQYLRVPRDDHVMPRESVQSDPYVIRGAQSYNKISIYTLAGSIFRPDK